jgi:hypothetical protein
MTTDEQAREILFRDEAFLAKMSAKTVGLLRSYTRMIERECEIPKAMLAEALILFTASEIEAGLSREHAVDFLKKLTSALEKSTAVTVQ